LPYWIVDTLYKSKDVYDVHVAFRVSNDPDFGAKLIVVRVSA